MQSLWIPLLLLWAAPSPGTPAYERANALFTAKKFAECSAALDEALSLDAKLVPALTLRARLAMAMNRFDVARESLDRALAADPASAWAHFLYGLQYFIANDLYAARPHFEQAHRLNPRDSRAALYLGLTAESLGDTAQALGFYRDAVQLEEKTAHGVQAETLLPGARLLLLMGDLRECERWLGLALKAAPASRDVHFEQARLLLAKNQPAPAGAEAELALQLSDGTTTDAQVHYLAIRAFTKNEQPDKAERHAEALRALEAPRPN